jgi:RNA polymerase sigma factor FliA
MDREALILEHLPQVRWIAYRIHRRLPANAVSVEDLESAGVLGLIAAVDGFDATRGHKLKTYAEFRIRGAILDSLRRHDIIPRNQRTQRKRAEAEIVSLEQELRRAPTEAEIAARLQMTTADYRLWLQIYPVVTVGSLEQETGSLLRYVADPAQSAAELVERRELETALAEAIERLPRRERTIVSLYFYDSLTIREIGRVMHYHESRISQLKSQAILRLRAHLRRRWPAERDAEAA